MPKVALVTGGASGIGRAACLKFAKLGVAVVVADLDEAGGQQTVEQVSAAFSATGGTHTGGSPSSTFVKTDVSKEEDVEQLMNHIRTTYGRLDYCMDNAGIEGVGAPTADQPTDSFDKVMSVNARGVFLCLKHQIPLMLETAEGQGAIVIISSVAGVQGYPGMAAYAASKHAVVGMMRCAAAEYGPQGLRVNCINPGATDTPLLSRLASSMPGEAGNLETLAATYPLRRLATPEEIAEAAVWACTRQPL